MAKKNTWDIAKGKIDKNKPTPKEEKKPEKRKMIRIDEHYHTKAKFELAPPKRMGLQEYIEALIQKDIDGEIKW